MHELSTNHSLPITVTIVGLVVCSLQTTAAFVLNVDFSMFPASSASNFCIVHLIMHT